MDKLKSLEGMITDATNMFNKRCLLLYAPPENLKKDPQIAQKLDHKPASDFIMYFFTTDVNVFIKNFVDFDREEAEAIFSIFTKEPQYFQIAQLLRIPKYITESVLYLAQFLMIEWTEYRAFSEELIKKESFLITCNKLMINEEELIMILKFYYRSYDDNKDFKMLCQLLDIDKVIPRTQFKVLISFSIDGFQKKELSSIDEEGEEALIRQQINFLRVALFIYFYFFYELIFFCLCFKQ